MQQLLQYELSGCLGLTYSCQRANPLELGQLLFSYPYRQKQLIYDLHALTTVRLGQAF